MPSITTHYLLATDALKGANQHLLAMILDYPKAFNIGTSGPDLFFYYNAFPWLDQKEARKVAHYGSLVHSTKINEFFKSVFTQISLLNDPAMISHVAGLLCHWAMDKTCHPYIFYQTEGEALSTYYHRQFESTLDSLILYQFKHHSIQSFHPCDIVAYDQSCIDGIYKAYHLPLLQVYNIQLDKKVIETALKHFHKAQQMLHDTSGTKKKSLEFAEKYILKKPYLLSSMIAPLDTVDHLDILNLSHQTWHHPVTGLPSAESFIDLYQDSVNVASTVLHLFNQFLLNHDEMTPLLAYINNQSFETGLSTYHELQYHDCIYTRKNNTL